MTTPSPTAGIPNADRIPYSVAYPRPEHASLTDAAVNLHIPTIADGQRNAIGNPRVRGVHGWCVTTRCP